MNCIFCQDKLFVANEQKKLKVTQCGHVFHETCFEEAVSKK